MTNYEIIEKFESDKVKSSLDIAGGVFVETDLVHEIVKALRSQPCEDAISRQAAIDAIERNAYRHTYIDQIVDIIKALPSAQSEQRWILCSDENPKAAGRYSITGKMGTVYSLDFEDGRWYGGIKPVAWMPLPKPYNAETK